MKRLLIAISLMTSVVSTQANASGDAISANSAAFTFSPLFPIVMTTFISSALTEEWSANKEALQVLKEGQEYFQNGEMGILIAQKVEQLQEEQEMSDDEAVDSLMNQASNILK
jgi:hypothetical protein